MYQPKRCFVQSDKRLVLHVSLSDNNNVMSFALKLSGNGPHGEKNKQRKVQQVRKKVGRTEINK